MLLEANNINARNEGLPINAIFVLVKNGFLCK